MYDAGGLINAGREVNAAEQAWRIFCSFRGPKEDIAARIERVVECAADLLLQLAFEIDQDVPAGDQIDVRKRRVFEQIVDGEQNYIADLLTDPVVIALARKKTAQPLFADIGFDGERIPALACRSERAGIKI